jgi:hypothetical protein
MKVVLIQPMLDGDASPSWIVVEPPQCLLNIMEFLLCLLERRLNALDADIIIGLVPLSGLVLSRAVMLNLFAAVLDFSETECGGGSFEEVAERGELIEVLLLSALD